MKKPILIAVLALAAVGTAIAAQAPAKVTLQPGEDKQILTAIGQQLGKDLKGLTQRTYQLRTNIQMNGEDKGATLVQVAFGPDGKPIITPLSAPPPPGREKRGLRGAVQQDMKDEAKQQVDALVQLSNGYLILGQEKFQMLSAKAELQIVPAENVIKLVAKSFLQPGDQVFYKFDAKTNRQVSARIETSAGGSPVVIEAQYKALPSGQTTNAQTEITVPAKALKITQNTFGYQPQ